MQDGEEKKLSPRDVFDGAVSNGELDSSSQTEVVSFSASMDTREKYFESSDRSSVSTIRVHESDICYSQTPIGRLAPEINENDGTFKMKLNIKE